MKLSTFDSIRNRESHSVSDSHVETKVEKKLPKLPNKSEKKEIKNKKTQEYREDEHEETSSNAYSNQNSNSTFPKEQKLPKYQDLKPDSITSGSPAYEKVSFQKDGINKDRKWAKPESEE